MSFLLSRNRILHTKRADQERGDEQRSRQNSHEAEPLVRHDVHYHRLTRHLVVLLLLLLLLLRLLIGETASITTTLSPRLLQRFCTILDATECNEGEGGAERASARE